MIFLAGIGAIALFVLIIYLITNYYDNQSIKAEENRGLIHKGGYENEFDSFRQSHPELSYEQASSKFLKDENKKKEVMSQAQKRVQLDKEYEENAKRESIKKRVFAYDYENFIFSLFSPLAKKNMLSSNTEEWICLDSLPKAYVLKKMEEKYGANAIHLYDQFIENNLLWEMKDGSIDLGFILQHNSNVVVDTDLNIDKYIKQFGQRCSYAELQAEISSIIDNNNKHTEPFFTIREFANLKGMPTNAGQLPLKDSEGNNFKVQGMSFGTTFVPYSPQIIYEHPEENAYYIAKYILTHSSDYEITQKMEWSTMNNNPVYVVCHI